MEKKRSIFLENFRRQIINIKKKYKIKKIPPNIGLIRNNKHLKLLLTTEDQHKKILRFFCEKNIPNTPKIADTKKIQKVFCLKIVQIKKNKGTFFTTNKIKNPNHFKEFKIWGTQIKKGKIPSFIKIPTKETFLSAKTNPQIINNEPKVCTKKYKKLFNFFCKNFFSILKKKIVTEENTINSKPIQITNILLLNIISLYLVNNNKNTEKKKYRLLIKIFRKIFII